MCVYVFVCVEVYVRTFVCYVCVCTCACAYMHVWMYIHVQHCICMNLCANVSACVLCHRIVQSCVTTPQTGSQLQCQLRDTGTWYNVITPHALTSLWWCQCECWRSLVVHYLTCAFLKKWTGNFFHHKELDAYHHTWASLWWCYSVNADKAL